jgi:hypothetical protein
MFQGAIPLDIDDHDDMECSDPERIQHMMNQWLRVYKVLWKKVNFS